MQSIQEFDARYVELTIPIDEVESAQLMAAGSAMLDELGFYSQLLPIVEKYGQTLDYWLSVDVGIVYTILLYEYRKAKIHSNLALIKQQAEKVK